MDGKAPVLTERDDIRLWKQICKLESDVVRITDRSMKTYKAVLKEINESGRRFNPLIISRLMHVSDLYDPDNMQNIILGLLERCELTDCRPQLTAAKLFIDIGSYDSAKLLLDRMTILNDVSEWEYLRGLVAEYEGDRE